MNKEETKLEHTPDVVQEALKYHRSGRLQEAEAIYKSILKEQPQNVDALHLLGVLFHTTKKNQAAIELIEKAIEINPSIPDFYLNCGNVYRTLNKPELAIERYNKALSIKPNFPEVFNNLGNTYQALGETEKAIAYYEKAIAIEPTFAEAYNNLGNVLKASGNNERAIKNYNQAIVNKPNSPESYNNLGNIYKTMGQYNDAIASYEKAISIKTDYAQAFHNLAIVFKKLDQHEKAIHNYKRSLNINPENAKVNLDLGISYQELNRIKEAIACFEKAIFYKPNFARAYRALSYANPNKSLIKNIEKNLEDSSNTEEEIMDYHYSLGFICNRHEEFEDAFKHFSKANKLKRKTVTYNSKNHTEFVDILIHFYTKRYFLEKTIKGSDSELPVFIVGMPRSGTSLVEQIISSHPNICGAGELDSFTDIEKEIAKKLGSYPESISMCQEKFFDEYIEKYLNDIKTCSETAARITDKLPHNFLRLGLIKTLFPNARIIHCRRNPLDTCVSIFLNYFAVGNEFSFNLKEIAEHYSNYHRLMKHWESVLETEIFHVQYEELISNQETISRQLVEYLGLDWDEKCLEFYHNERMVKTASYLQVRKPIYNESVNRWKRYEKHLDPLISVLKQHNIL